MRLATDKVIAATTTSTLYDFPPPSNGLSTAEKAGIGAAAAGFVLCWILYIWRSCNCFKPRSYTGTGVNLGPVLGTGGGGGRYGGGNRWNASSNVPAPSNSWLNQPRNDPVSWNHSWNHRNNSNSDRRQQDSWTTSRPVDTGPSPFAREEARQDVLRAAERQRDDDRRAADRERDSRAVVDSYMKIPV
jgi:hypothetical protein